MNPLRIATRGSDLALAQARYIASRIEQECGRATELVIVRTTGDAIQNQSLAKIGGKGLFVKEIEEALLEDRADVAVHSAKDLPAKLEPGLVLAAFPERVDPRDALVSRTADACIANLPQGARVGTGSTRRSALLRAERPDLEIVPLRGNVPTRIGKLESENLDAVILACAGLERLGLQHEIRERIPESVMLPAVCQGTLALETRRDDEAHELIAALDDPRASLSVRAERSFLTTLEGDCTVPMAVHLVSQEDGQVWVRGLVASLDGKRVVRAEARGAPADAEALGIQVAREVLANGGEAILRELSESA